MSNKLKYVIPFIVLYLTPLYKVNCIEQEYTNLYCEESEVVTASPPYTFLAEFNALFFKPSASNLYYAAEAITSSITSPQWNIFDIRPGYHFGFDLGANIVFHGINTNLMLHWIHFNSSNSTCQQVSPQNMIGPFFEIGPDAAFFKKATGNVKFRFNEINFDYGQLINFGDRLSTNLFCGIGFVQIKQNLLSVFSSLDNTAIRAIQIPISFIGAGPQFGIDFSYCIIKGLNLNGKTHATLFSGKLKNHSTTDSINLINAEGGIVVPPPAPTPPMFLSIAPDADPANPVNIQMICSQNRSQLIPAFEESISISYDCFYNCFAAKIEVGYQAKIFLNALQSTVIGSEVDTLPAPGIVGVFARTFQRILSNFALSGPYIALSIGF